MANTPAIGYKFDDISEINTSKDAWAVVATPIRLWVVPSFSGKKLPYSMELVLMDAKGGKIHASVRQSLIYKFQPLMNEGRVYQISSFGVEESRGDFRTTGHGYKINFQFSTSVRLVKDLPINRSPYSFMPLSDVALNNPDSYYLIDVMGILTGYSEELEFEKDGKKNKKMTIEIEQDGVRMECAFFGNYVAEVLGQIAAGDKNNAVIVIQLAKIKPFRGKISLQNAYGSTRILFNPDVEGANSLRQRFLEAHEPAAQVLNHLPNSGKISVSDDFLKRHWGKTVEQIKNMRANLKPSQSFSIPLEHNRTIEHNKQNALLATGSWGMRAWILESEVCLRPPW
ncbi:replication protein A 70 kDa DNA-binding subunit C-like [Lotus japonicus]|uniref:replication protein A 70 kDa DNA-binding subunit C-like n=1 Tax=Lotus japonicus TaxID=34305 RepID=UPI002585A4A8|nr:replication protein A 70 kDa DNA-binding subunit C-like [Lotus japonicus]